MDSFVSVLSSRGPLPPTGARRRSLGCLREKLAGTGGCRRLRPRRRRARRYAQETREPLAVSHSPRGAQRLTTPCAPALTGAAPPQHPPPPPSAPTTPASPPAPASASAPASPSP